MRDRKKRNIIIGSLCCLLVFMGIGYAILSQTLNISGIARMQGNWNVRITNMELLSENKTGRAEEVSHSFTDTTATFTADLYMPGDSIEYRVTVENQGNIDALLKSITPTTTNKSEGIKFSHSEIDNTVLTAGKTITFTMKVEFLEGATSIPNVENVKYNLELVYVQYNGGEYTPAVETTEEDCFMISDDGTLLSYDKSCGTDNVVIPAKINNIPVKRIADYAFMSSGGVAATTTTSGDGVYIFKNEEARTKFIDSLKNEGSSDEEINGVMQSSYINGSTELSSLKLKTEKDYILESGDGQKFKIYKDSSNAIQFDDATSTDYNIIYFSPTDTFIHDYYCTTSDACNLLKEYFRSKDPARNYGVTDSSYYEYLYKPGSYSATGFQSLDNLDYVFYYAIPDTSSQSKAIKTLDLSQAIYVEELSGTAGLMSGAELTKKVILPPNVKALIMPLAEEVIFPPNSTTEFIGESGVGRYVKAINLPSSLKVIGENALKVSSLTSVVIPSSVVRIGQGAFAGDSVTTLKFEKDSHLIAIYGSDCSEYDAGAFEGNKLSNVIIPKSVEYIGDEAFSNNNLTTVSFEEGSKLKAIGAKALQSNKLTSITIPSSVEEIGVSAFDGNQITTINFESNSKLKTIGASALYYNKLTSITIPSSVETIGERAFASNQMTTINFESNSKLKTIGSETFAYNALTSITIPSSVETIGRNAFDDNQMTTINFESNSKLKTIEEYAFKYNKLTSITIPSSVETIGDYAFKDNRITAINFEPNSELKTIGNYAFGYNDLTSITIPSSVETIGGSAFCGNDLTTINFESNSKLKTIDNDAFRYNQLTNTGLGKLPSSLTSLATDAFRDNPDLTQITLTSPKDLPGWPNGGTVNGKTVTYER